MFAVVSDLARELLRESAEQSRAHAVWLERESVRAERRSFLVALVRDLPPSVFDTEAGCRVAVGREIELTFRE